MSDELKPCPWCGGSASENVYDRDIIGGTVESETLCGCADADCIGSSVLMCRKHWNTRPTEDALRARITELERKTNFTYCAYCGKEYPLDTDGSDLSKHIAECEKHPMAALRAELEAARRRVAELEAQYHESEFGKYGRRHYMERVSGLEKGNAVLLDDLQAARRRIGELKERNKDLSMLLHENVLNKDTESDNLRAELEAARQALKKSESSLEFYRSRIWLLEREKYRMRQPELMLVVDIIANCGLLPDEDGSRYGHKQDDDLRARLERAVGLLDVAKCPECDGDGMIYYPNTFEDIGKCQWCAERKAVLDAEKGES